MDERIRQIIGSKRNKISVDTDTNLNITLDDNSRLLKTNANQITEVVSEDEQFNLERDSSLLYRLNGRLNIITANELSILACDDSWDPLIYQYGEDTSPNNWVLQICYPVNKRPDYIMSGGYPISYGLNIDSIYQSEKINNRYQTIIKTKQKHKLNVGDYVHINSTASNNPYQGIHKVEKLGNTSDVTGLTGSTIDDAPYYILLESSYKTNFNGKSFLKRVVNVSDSDFNYLDSKPIGTVQFTDFSGNTGSNTHVLINTPD